MNASDLIRIQDKATDLQKRVREIKSWKLKHAADSLVECERGTWADGTPMPADYIERNLPRHKKDKADAEADIAALEIVLAQLATQRPARESLPFQAVLAYFQGTGLDAAICGLELLGASIAAGQLVSGAKRRIGATLSKAKASKKLVAKDPKGFEAAMAPLLAKMAELDGETQHKAMAESGRGTCQCCFEVHQLPRLKVALHGYERPGHGHIVGRCRGEGYVPYEISCARTKAFLIEVVAILMARQGWLSKLERNGVAELGAEVTTGKKVPHPEHSWMPDVAETKVVMVKRGAAASENPFHADAREKVPSFETLRQRAISEAKREVDSLTRHCKFLEGKITAWKFVQLPGFEAPAA